MSVRKTATVNASESVGGRRRRVFAADAMMRSARVRVYFQKRLRDRSRTLRGPLNGPPQPWLYVVFNGQTINILARMHGQPRGEPLPKRSRREKS